MITAIRIFSAGCTTMFILFSLQCFAQEPTVKPHGRAHHALVYDEAHKLVLMTSGSTPLNGGQSSAFFNDIWYFDGRHWTLTQKSGNERSGIGLAYNLKQDRVYSFGGYVGDSSVSDLRVLENGEWKTLAYLPQMKAAEPGFTYDAKRDRFVVFGGSAGRQNVNGDTWEWDGKEWIKFNGLNPAPRQAFAMVYDSRRNKTVLFGGMGTTPGQLFNDTWEFDGTTWLKVSEDGPSPRASAGFAYDANAGMMIIFGGMTKEGFVSDTWGWDGKEWKKIAHDGPERMMAALGYDEAKKILVLFGGGDANQNNHSDTWQLKGDKWVKVSDNGSLRWNGQEYEKVE